MPLENPNVVDTVRKGEDGKIVLVITDEGNVTDPKERVVCLIQKLKAYINNIVSGDLKREYPEHTARDFIIEVVCRQRPTQEMATISQVTPRKDPANKVPVKFVEFPVGAWGAGKVEWWERAESSPADASREAAEKLDPLSAAALKKGMDVAMSYVADGQKGFYFAVLGWEENKTEAVYFSEDALTDEIVKEVDQYVRELTPAFTVCVLVSVGNMKSFNRGKREAIVLALHRRGREMARIYARPIRQKGMFHKYQYSGSLELVSMRPGLFPV